MVNRVATYAYTNTLLDSNMRLQSKYADINTQISSGLKSQNYKGISQDSQYLLAVESSIDRLTAYNANANTVSATVNTMYSTMTKVQDLANSMISTLTSALGGNQVPGPVVASAASNALNEMASLLNLNVGGRYIFSGTDIDTKPVDLNDPAWVAQTTPSTANSTYYQGNGSIVSVQTSETMTINYGVVASNPAFEQMLRAFNLALNNPTNPAALQEASTLVQQSVKDVANIQGILSTQAHSIETQIDKNDTDKNYLKELSSNIKETDIPSASVQLTEAQTQLEAAYSASVRVLQLSLTNYLN